MLPRPTRGLDGGNALGSRCSDDRKVVMAALFRMVEGEGGEGRIESNSYVQCSMILYCFGTILIVSLAESDRILGKWFEF